MIVPLARRCALLQPAAVALAAGCIALAAPILPAAAQAPIPAARTALVPFDIAPFPYRGIAPRTGKPFLDVEEGERRGRNAPRGGILWEDTSYSDRRVLLSIPRGFDIRRPAVIVMFFHGNGATLSRDVLHRQQVPRQIEQSGRNAVLVAPQFAVDAADSSAGRFWEPGVFAQFLGEAADRLARLHGDARARAVFERAPLMIAAYSGGYHPLAYVLTIGGATERVRGVFLLDALYGDHDKYLDWLVRRPQAFFVSTYGPLVKVQNEEFQKQLSERGIAFTTDFPPHLVPGINAFLDVGVEVKHNDFVTQAWSADPLKVLLSRVPGYVRR
ncbi:MAG: alpha/beta hydrolase [Hyphomicrobiales bacterium]|nr:alpha/beta hydrolase [Hyphomicrobiales bacterium]